MKVVVDASKYSLKGFIKENDQPESIIITDGWPSYTSLPQEGYPYIFDELFDANVKDAVLPHVHMLISLLKRWLLGNHQGAVQETHLQAYLDEYVFRFNRRRANERGLLFYRLLENAMQVQPSTQDE